MRKSSGSLITGLWSYIGLFLGVSLIAFSVKSAYYPYWVLGSALATVSLVFFTVHYMGVKSERTWSQSIVLVLSYLFSAIGVGFSVGAWLSLNQGRLHFFFFLLAGLVLSVVNRYAQKRGSLLAVIEDYLIYFFVFMSFALGVSGVIGFLAGSWSFVGLWVLSSALTTVLVWYRSWAIFNQKSGTPWSTLATLFESMLGLTMIVTALVRFLQVVSGAPVTWGFSDGAILVVGVALFLWGALSSPTRRLVVVKDLL